MPNKKPEMYAKDDDKEFIEASCSNITKQRKRRRKDSSLKSYFIPNHSEDPLAPPLKKTPQSSSPFSLSISSKSTKNSDAHSFTASTSFKPKKTNNPLSSNSNQRNSSKTQQLYLDFGQKSFGKRTICPICNMLFVHGVSEDESQHKKICHEYKMGVAYPGWKNERLIRTFQNEEKIIEVRSTDPLHHLMKIKRLKSIIDKEMSFAPSNTQLPPTLTYYLFISAQKRIAGFLSVHALSEAYPLLQGNPSQRSQISQKAVMGIHQIWTLKSRRRNGMAKKLLDAARKHLLYGMIIEKSTVAFSSPTGDGVQLAKAYLGDDCDMLVYDC